VGGQRRSAPRVDLSPAGAALRLVLRPAFPLDPGQSTGVEGTIDVGAGGRLLGVEVPLDPASPLAAPWRGGDPPPSAAFDPESGGLYLPLEPDPGASAGALVRSVRAPLRLLADPQGALVAVEVPRRGHGYEIAYPSGNR
jgi:hypothetical protein